MTLMFRTPITTTIITTTITATIIIISIIITSATSSSSSRSGSSSYSSSSSCHSNSSSSILSIFNSITISSRSYMRLFKCIILVILYQKTNFRRRRFCSLTEDNQRRRIVNVRLQRYTIYLGFVL